MEIVRISEKQNLTEKAAKWFHEKWDNPEELYLESLQASLDETALLPKWYLVVEGDEIIGGAGVIGNDFHERKDAAPNVCAVYVEKEYRCQGIAGKLLQFICDDMEKRGVDTLYLITDHDSFYERYGWQFMTVIKDDEGEEIRLYKHVQ